MASSYDEPPLTDEQREELDRRLDDLEREGPVGILWEEMLAQVRRRSAQDSSSGM